MTQCIYIFCLIFNFLYLSFFFLFSLLWVVSLIYAIEHAYGWGTLFYKKNLVLTVPPEHHII